MEEGQLPGQSTLRGEFLLLLFLMSPEETVSHLIVVLQQKARDNRAAQRINKVQLSNESLQRLQPPPPPPPQGVYDPIAMETEAGCRDPLRPRESEQEQEWKLRQVSIVCFSDGWVGLAEGEVSHWLLLYSDNATEEQAAGQDGGNPEAGAGEERAAAAAAPPVRTSVPRRPRPPACCREQRHAEQAEPPAGCGDTGRCLPQTSSSRPLWVLFTPSLPFGLLPPPPATIFSPDVLPLLLPPLLTLGPI